MRTTSRILFLALLVSLFYLTVDTVEAARMGGGKSFGSRPSYQRSAPAPSPNTGSSTQVSPGATTQQRPAGTIGSPTGRWGGMLGGLLMGGLIGSLLFGSGQVGGGIGLFDILLIGGGLFLLMRFLRTRRMATQTPGGGGALPFDSGSGNAWGSDNYTAYAKPGSPAVAAPVYPKGFDADDFLRGANQIYIRLQSSWDRRDLEDIRQFAADDVYEEIRRQAKEDPHPSKTELLRIEPRILEVRDVQGQIVVSVLYDCMLRENEKEMARQVRELWHFSRQAGDTKSFWLLEGIQQVEL